MFAHKQNAFVHCQSSAFVDVVQKTETVVIESNQIGDVEQNAILRFLPKEIAKKQDYQEEKILPHHVAYRQFYTALDVDPKLLAVERIVISGNDILCFLRQIGQQRRKECHYQVFCELHQQHRNRYFSQ